MSLFALPAMDRHTANVLILFYFSSLEESMETMWAGDGIYRSGNSGEAEIRLIQKSMISV
jgi:hypothetical protein